MDMGDAQVGRGTHAGAVTGAMVRLGATRWYYWVGSGDWGQGDGQIIKEVGGIKKLHYQ